MKLNSAFLIEDGDESVRRVKEIISDALVEADPTVAVVRTEYFNHSYVPDLVLEWPSRGTSATRKVYLRPTQNPIKIEMDVKEHASTHPMFVYLSELVGQNVAVDGSGFGELSETAHASETLVTEVGAFERLIVQSSAPGATLLPSSILRGGRGLLREETADNTAAIISRGFAGALEADRASTAMALSVISEVLDHGVATEMTSIMETMWIASGGTPVDFPGENRNIGLRLSSERLASLLGTVPQALEAFWIRVGRSVSMESFSSLNLVGEQPALQFIISAALSHLVTRACRVENTVRADQVSDPFIWQVEDGNLSLRGLGRQAWVGQRVDQLPRKRAEDSGVRPSPRQLLSRSKRSGTPVTSVELVGDGRTVTYGSAENADIAGDESVMSFDRLLGPDAVANRAMALASGSKPVTVDFLGNAAFGGPTARVEVSRLIWIAWSMTADLTTAQQDVLATVLGPFEIPSIEDSGRVTHNSNDDSN
ncbi:hypothetical protein [Nocardia aurantia]|uniref:hypothetical protein n=1 Tax=Nocardia aurantia TaxID=2585199 RepID=UPI001296D322|nr:hypothetical protein [Nocardia aurantia]